VIRAAAALALAAVMTLALLFAGGAPEPRRFADSESYLDCARQPLGLDFFFSDRPPLAPGPVPAPEDGLYRNRPPSVPLLYRACGLDPGRIVVAQSLLYAGAAAVGIVLLAGSLAAGWAGRLSLGALLVALALTWNLSGWTRTLLSESPVLALLWLVVGGTADHLARGRRAALALAGAAAFLLLFARDSALLLVVPILAGAALAARWRGERNRFRPLAIALAAILAAAALAQWGTLRGRRTELPLLNVLFYRIAPEPAALDWFRARGLDWSPELEAFRGHYAFEHDLELFRAPRLRPFRDWFEAHGRGLYARFLLTHPGFVARVTAAGSADLFGAELATYLGVPPSGLFRWIDLLTRGAGVWLCALTLGVAAALIARRDVTPEDLFPFVLAIAFLAHGLAVLHADAAEPERHCFPTLIGLQLAALLAVARAAGGRRRNLESRALTAPSSSLRPRPPNPATTRSHRVDRGHAGGS
jgi:hypothetical protein